MALQTISECVYVGLKIGTAQQVAIRREKEVISELSQFRLERVGQDVRMLSGRKREGFRLDGSDIDFIFWENNHRVLWEFSQAQFCNTNRHNLILCDNSESPPGFTLLWLPLEEANSRVLSSCERINRALYISCAKYRDNRFSMMGPDSTEHGPCSSGIIAILKKIHDHHLR